MTDAQFTDLMITLKRIESHLEELVDSQNELNDRHDDIVDPMYDDVAKLILTVPTVSASFLQRRISIGYSRAARLLDALEEEGLVEHAEGSKPRRVIGYIDPETK